MKTEKTEVNFELVGKRVKKMRKQTEMTQAELAEAAGYVTATIANTERGRTASLTVLYNIALVLGVSIDYLVGMPVTTESLEKKINRYFIDCTPDQQKIMVTAMEDLYLNLKKHMGLVDKNV